MSKQGRSSIVLLGLVVAGLLLAPLVYLAVAARIDRDALNRRIAVLQATAVDGPASLQARYRVVCERMLPVLPPNPEMRVNHSAGTIVFDPLDFADWIDDLEPTELNGVTVYPVTVAEDPETRDTIFYNGLAVPIAVLAPEQDYDPFAWLAAHRPELYAENAVPAVRAKAEALFDPARVCVTFYLLPVEDVSAMAGAQLAAVQQLEAPMNMMMGEGLPEPVTNLVIFAMERVTNGMALGIGWPYDFTNKLEVFARTNLAPTGWFVASTNLSTIGTNSLWWTDTALSTSILTRFYRVGNADLDSDFDGLTDARGRFIYGTEPALDSDADGLVDGYSGTVMTNIYPGGAYTNGGSSVEGEMTWGTDLRLFDTDGDGMGDGWEVVNGHDPLDANDPPNVSGVIHYTGGQTGTIWVVAVTSSNSWSTNYCSVLASPGAYLIPNLPATNYWLKAWLDTNGNGSVDYPEAMGLFTNNPVVVSNRVADQDITLADPDNDSDGLPDWWEIDQYGSVTNWNGFDDADADQYTNREEWEANTDPKDSASHPWNISGTIAYTGPQTGLIHVAACTSATGWAAAQYAVIGAPGAYTITHLPPDTNYWIRAWRDTDIDESPAFWEAWGAFPDNPVSLNTNVAAIDVTLVDHDSDGDSLPDWWEVKYGFDPLNGGGNNARAWWKLDETAGTNVQDSTAHANNGVLLDAGTNSWTGGVISNALALDGVNGFVQIQDSESLKPNYASVSLWVKPSRDYTNGCSAVFFSKKQPAGATGYRLSYEHGELSFLVCASGEKAVTLPCNLASGVWYHVVGTYGGSIQMLYVDGYPQELRNYNWGPAMGFIDQGTTAPRIGASTASAPGDRFAGVIDDVRVYGGELSGAQVYGIYEVGSDGDGDGLTAWQEYRNGLNPTNPDTDSDGLLDGEELIWGTDPLDPDSDDDGLCDGDEVNVWHTDPLNPDTDSDDLQDGAEVNVWHTDPLVTDTDRDGFTDSADSNATSRVFIRWGDPSHTEGANYIYSGPAWWTAAYKTKGVFLAEPPYGWRGTPAAFSATNMVSVPAGTIYVTEPDYGSYLLNVGAFRIDRTEVTKAKWDEVRGWGLSNGYTDIAAGSAKGTNHPVQSVNWYDCVKWCNARSEMEGLTPAYYTTYAKNTVYRNGDLDLESVCVNWASGYRLPTVQEWEYASRGGVSNTRFPWGNTIDHSQANYYSSSSIAYDVSPTQGYHPSFSSNGTPYTSPVGSFSPFGYGAGLYDMVGNVYEWVWDWYPPGGTRRMSRGGSWNAVADHCKVAYSGDPFPSSSYDNLGFRAVSSWSGTGAQVITEALVIAVDRTILTNNLVMTMDYMDRTNSTLYIGLANTNHILFVPNLFGNLMAGRESATHIAFDIPFTNYPDAAEIRIWSDRGEAIVYTNSLYFDKDRDGLDVDQEEQLGGTDNDDYDADDDGLTDAEEMSGAGSFSINVTTNANQWVEKGTAGVFLTQWSGVVSGRVDKGYAAPIAFPVVLGSYTGSTVQIAVDGYLFIDTGLSSNTPSKRINLPEYKLCVAPFWDDLTVSAATGVWVEATGTGAAARLTVTWSGVETKTADQRQGMDFQCVYSASNRGYAFNYRNSAGTAFPSNAFYTVGLWGDAQKPVARLAFNRTGLAITPGMNIVVAPAVTDTNNWDSDGDGLSDGQEVAWGFDPTTFNSPLEDWDGDSLSLEAEVAAGTDPTLRDTDSDGWTDGQELDYDLDPLVFLDPAGDEDMDGSLNWDEWEHGTNPNEGYGFRGFEEGASSQYSPMYYGVTKTVWVCLSDGEDGPGDQGATPGGIVLQFGDVQFRRPPDCFVPQWWSVAVEEGRAYELRIIPVEGVVESEAIHTELEVNGHPLIPTSSPNRSVIDKLIVDDPSNALGDFPNALDRGPSLLSYPVVWIEFDGREALDDETGEGLIHLEAKVAPENILGAYHWSIPDDGISTIRVDGASADVVSPSDEAPTVTVTFTPSEIDELFSIEDSVTLHQNHFCHWDGSLNLNLPLVVVNDNDSDNNGTNDFKQATPPPGDPQLREGTLAFTNDTDMLPCCQLLYPAPMKVSLVCESFDKVRVWNEGGTAPFTFPTNETVGTEQVWTFMLEGTNVSAAVGDVRFAGTVKFADESEVPFEWGTTVCKVGSVRYRRDPAENFIDLTDGTVLLKSQTVEFKAVFTPVIDPLPTDSVQWTGSFGTTGNEETVSHSYDSAVSTSDTDYKTVIANKISVNVVVSDKVLGIHSNADPAGSLFANQMHAWISLTDYSSSSTDRTTYGLWDESVQPEQNLRYTPDVDLYVNIEAAWAAGHRRYYLLLPSQYAAFMNWLDEDHDFGWFGPLPTYDCASFASDTIATIIGEDVDADDEAAGGMETPREVSQSVDALEATDPTTLKNPFAPTGGSSGGCSWLWP